MAIGVVAGAATIVATVVAAPAVATAVAVGAGSAATATATGAAVATAGAVAGGTATVAATGAATAIAAGATEALATLAAPLITSGPWGWVALGAEDSDDGWNTSWDCWKKVVHEKNLDKSTGRLLSDLAVDPRVKDIICDEPEVNGVPNIFIVNQWNEKFQVQLVIVANGQLAGHVIEC